MATDNELQRVKAAINPEGIRKLGTMLSGRFTQYESDRRLAELKWARNARQYLGIYDPDIEAIMDKNRSRAYPKLTRVKCVSMLSRLMNLLFQADDKCWGVSASAVPDLSTADLQKVLDQVTAVARAEQRIPDNDEIEEAIRTFAAGRAVRLELEIEDQLQELGGARSVSYVALCRKVLASGIQYGMGVLKGPFTETQQLRKWVPDATGQLVATAYETLRPRFEFVPLWDYYPDMSAKYVSQMDGQFQRVVMSRHQLLQLKNRPDFLPEQIDLFLRQSPTGNYKRRAFETEIKSMGVQLNVTEAERNKYEAFIWEGCVTGRELHDAGVEIIEEQMSEDLRAEIWFLGSTVIKADIDPWSLLDNVGEIPRYHHFVFEEDESTLLGNGLPNIMRDSQMGVCAATRMTMDNGSIQRNFEVNTSLLRADQDTTSIQTDKIWYRDDDSMSTMQVPAVRSIEMPMHLDEMQKLVSMFQSFADQETFVGPATGGDMQKQPSEPLRTAAGASMLRGEVALPFKDVVRNFDMFTESVIGALINFNKVFNTNPEVQGDFCPVARGATSLIAKEVLGIQLDSLAQTMTDEEKRYVNMHKFAIARMRARDLVALDLVCSEAEAQRRDDAATQQQQMMSDQQAKLFEAELRQILGDTLKAVTQAGKNSAAAETSMVNTILDALERGVPINDIRKSTQLAGTRNGTAAAGADAAGGGGPASPGAAPGATLAAARPPAAAMPTA